MNYFSSALLIRLCTATLFASTLLAATSSHAGNVVATMTDKAGAPLSNVVLFATPVGVAVPPPQRPPEPATIVQEELQFKPYVSAFRSGTAIGFPNNDKSENNVKSVSPAKEFEYKVND